jgi:hypothetical protein
MPVRVCAQARSPALGEVKPSIWKCIWCGKRKGKLKEHEIELLEDFFHRFGWTLEPLLFHEDGVVYAHCQLPALRGAGASVRRENSDVSTVPKRDAIDNGVRFHAESERALARRRSGAAKRESS